MECSIGRVSYLRYSFHNSDILYLTGTVQRIRIYFISFFSFEVGANPYLALESLCALVVSAFARFTIKSRSQNTVVSN